MTLLGMPRWAGAMVVTSGKRSGVIKERSVIIPTGRPYLSIPYRSASSSYRTSGAWQSGWRSKTRRRKTNGSLVPGSADAFNPMGGSSPPIQDCRPSSIRSLRWRRTDWTGKPIFINRSLDRSQDCSGQRIRPAWPRVAEAISAITGGAIHAGAGLRRPIRSIS